ncbi:MAG: transglycosylase domain-containing protein, partial [Bacteroidota bacterium]
MNNRKLWPRILVIIFWFLFITPVFVSVILFSRIANGKMGFMPTFEDLENPNNNIASEIYSEDTVLLGKLFYENRSYVDFHELSPNMVNSLLAIEDIRFYDHSGIDFKALIRVFWGLASGNRKGGGSTLTQQLAKNLFGRDTVTYDSKLESSYQLAITKFKEWITAVRLERNYTKNEILVMYLNTVPFGSNSFGIKTAARTFFNLTPDSLSINEAALLAGVVNAPTRYSPVRNPESSFQRRNLVLSQMLKYDYIKPEEYDSLIAEPIALKMNSQDHDVGLATYFRSFVRDYINAKPPVKGRYDYLEDSLKWIEDPLYGWCYKNKKPNGKPYDLFGDGLRIYTTLNSKMQKYAEQSVEEHLSEKLQKEFWTEKKGRRWGPYDLELEKEEYEYV